MKQDNLVLIPETVYGTANSVYIPPATSFNGKSQQAVGYYNQGSVNTVRFTVDDFVGIITLYASLDQNPTSGTAGDWIKIYTFPTDDSSSLDGISAISADFSTFITGKFTWIYAQVTGFEGGTINSVSLSY